MHRPIRSSLTLQPALTFEQLNARLYSLLFRTPAEDPWVGIGTRGVFNPLPVDGIEISGR
jgi:hypothetical protein